MGRARTTLKDIASKTGFSMNTVSLALRDSPRIPEATRAVIKQTAADLNYLPNQIAQSLVSQQSMTIGLILTDILNPTLTQVAQEISNNLSDRGYSTLFATSNNTIPKEIEVINTFRGRQVDGILIYPTDHQNITHMRTLRTLGYPVVSLVADKDNGLDTVSVDEHDGAYKVTDHLIDQGCQKIAILDSASPHGNTEKREGYLQAMETRGVEASPDLQINVRGHSLINGYNAMADLWAAGHRPDGVLATNDSIAVGVQRWCDENSLRIPDDIAIAGFDNVEFARLAAIPITTVAYPVRRIARTAVDHLIELIDLKGPLPEPVETLLNPELLIRRSSGG